MVNGPVLRPTPGILGALGVLAALACGGSAPASRASTLADSLGSREGAAALAALTADSAAILDNLRTLSADAMQGRGTGTPGAARARAFLERELRAAGVRPLAHPDRGQPSASRGGDEGAEGEFERAFTWRSSPEAPTHDGVNLVGTVPGAPGNGSARRFIVVSAHYDHLGVRGGQIYNGADDDASGAVGLLALARALRDHPLRHPLLYVEFDAEEEGLRGSGAFVADPPVPLADMALDLNLDMVSRTAGVLWAAGSHQTPALRPILEKVAARSPVELRLGHDHAGAPEGDDWTDQGDHGSFWDAGIPFVYLGVEDHPDYHRPTDDFDRIDPGEYMNALRATLMVLVALDDALPLPAASEERR